MATYVEFVGSGDFTGDNAGMIRDWANRDVSVLSNSVVTRCFDYAADKAYRTLRVPPLEVTRLYDVNGTQEEMDAVSVVGVAPDITPSAFLGGGAVLSMTVPSDLIEVIFIRNADTATKNSGIVYNEKVDVRTFNDGFGRTKDFNFYTRIGNNIKLHGNFTRGDVVELHYYRRLPAMNATYSATYTNWKSGLGTLDIGGVATTYSSAADKTEASFDTRVAASSAYWVGGEAAHWLRDENERIVLFGALLEVFIYLNDNEEIQKYQQLFEQELAEINKEEMIRKTKGGNLAMSFAHDNLL
jgi:hypothetical protein